MSYQEKSIQDKNEKSTENSKQKVYKIGNDYKEVVPDKLFYKTFSDTEILDMIQVLESQKIISTKYNYHGDGAKFWDMRYLDVNYTTPSSTQELLEEALDTIKHHLKKYQLNRINIVDLGSGNSYPMRPFLKELQKLNLLNKYIAIDISNELLNISKRNIKKWLPKIDFVAHKCDFERDYFYPVIFENKFSPKNEKIGSIIMELGGTAGNHLDFERVLLNVKNSMSGEDLFFINDKVLFKNDPTSRADILDGGYLFSPEKMALSKWIPKIIGIITEDCDTTYLYNEEKNLRLIVLTLDKDYAITFHLFNNEKRITLDRGTHIQIWNHSPIVYENILQSADKCGLRLNSVSTTADKKQAVLSYSLATSGGF